MGITIYSCERRKRQPSFATKNTCSNVLILGDQSRQVVQICSQRVRQVAKKREMLGSPSRNSYVNRCNSLEDPTQTITCRPRHHDLQSPKEASVTHVGKKTILSNPSTCDNSIPNPCKRSFNILSVYMDPSYNVGSPTLPRQKSAVIFLNTERLG